MSKITFNKQQQEAIDFKDGACGVIAAAGSGKSTLLLERIRKLVVEHKVPQREILAITFTRNTSDELTKKLSDMGLDYVNVGTFHSICSRILYEEGVEINGVNMIKEWQIDNCFRAIDQKVDVKDVMSFISYQKNHRISPYDTFDKKGSAYSHNELRVFYKAYENMKKKEGLYDFDDYLLMCLDILEDNPGKHTFDYVLVDEHQDTNKVQQLLLEHWCKSGNIFTVFDFRQCLLPNTKVKTPNGHKAIKDIKENDIVTVASGRGDSISTKVSEVLKKSYKGKIIKLKTESGNVIQATPEHTIFLNTTIPEMKYFVYLMYKSGYGYRIGITSQHKVLRKASKKSENSMFRNGYENRIRYEGADKLWIIKTADTIHEAIYYENIISYSYGIPQYVFKSRSEGGKEGLPQEDVKKMYNNIPTIERGEKLLSDMGLYINEPHVEVTGYMMKDIDSDDNSRVKRRISFTLFGSSRKSKSNKTSYRGNFHEISATSIDENFVKIVADTWGKNYTKQVNGSGKTTYSHARWTGKEHDFMMDLSEKACKKHGNATILRRAVMTDDPKVKFYFMPIANAIEGMSVPVYKDGQIVEDRIVEVTKMDYEGDVYDLNIDYYRNYIAENIVVHNCIYSFRGGEPKYAMNFTDYWKDATMKNVYINYRSPKNIVDKANKFIKGYYGDYKHYKDAKANNQTDGHIQINSRYSREVEATEVVDQIEQLIREGTELKDITILYRNNAHADFIENQLKRREIDYEIANDSSFFKRREIAGILSFLRLILNTEDDNAFEGVFRLRTYPLMYFSNKIFSDMQEYSNKNGVSLFEALQEIKYPKSWHMKNVITFVRSIERLKDEYERNDMSVITLINKVVNKFKIKEMVYNRYSNKDERDERLNSIEVLKAFVGNNTLEQFIAHAYNNNDKKRKKKENAVQLMTIHRSKGLEFDNVFVVGIEDGEFPSNKSDDITEEARLFYVACTRSKKNLWISEIGQGNRFVEEYGYDDVSYNKNMVADDPNATEKPINILETY